mmetsp:Transcript_54845/g.66082  ORF Transcript_54845/g.66082 Transcript_54845/m.66082 type:complete len:87 (+) Transcript_54845:190-450(+)
MSEPTPPPHTAICTYYIDAKTPLRTLFLPPLSLTSSFATTRPFSADYAVQCLAMPPSYLNAAYSVRRLDERPLFSGGHRDSSSARF